MRAPATAYRRLPLLTAVVFLAMTCVAARIAWLGAGRARAADTTSLAEIPAQRGTVWDRNGRLLATESYDRYEVLADTETITQPLAAAAQLAPILGRSDAEVLEVLGRETRWQTLSAMATGESADRIEQLDTPGVHVLARPSRHYPFGTATSHLLGYVDADGAGRFGVEETFDDLLEGLPGRRPGVYRTDPHAYIPVRDGDDLQLALDVELQLAVIGALERSLMEHSASSGTVLVLEPTTGDLLASASLPSFDPSNRPEFDHALFADPAIASIYPPGSVIKPLTLAAAIDAGLLAPGSRYEDAAVWRFRGINVYNPDRVGHGAATMQTMLSLSLNVGAAHVAEVLGEDRFYDALAAFGLGAPTASSLAGEVAGLLPAPGAADWEPSDMAFQSFGQGLSVTPMQVAYAMAALANDGLRMEPRILTARIMPGGRRVSLEPRPAAQVVAPDTAAVLREMMAVAVEDRVEAAQIDGYRVAGKTGTSEIDDLDGDGEHDIVASFAGLVPFDRPRIVVLVKLDRPADGGGQQVAAPLFAEVAALALDALERRDAPGLGDGR